MLGLMASPKVRMINVRLTPQMHEAFKIACELRGASMSSSLHQFIVRTIREEKDREPQAFRETVAGKQLATSSTHKTRIQKSVVSKGDSKRKTG